jgi:hypothetical protein
MPARKTARRAKGSGKSGRMLLRQRTPMVTVAMLALVLVAVTLGRTVHPAGHAAEDPEIRMECDIDHYGQDDPIVYPGQPGVSHMHSFYGNTSTNAYTTPATLAANLSSCSYLQQYDRSAYWIPSLYYKNPDGTSTKVSDASQQLVIYYQKPGGAGGPKITPFPVGLRMVAGDSHATSPQPQSITSWDCGDGGPSTSTIPDCTNAGSGHTLVGFVEFPNCWDGVHLDTADHKSHMAYADPTTGVCPAGHPVSLPQLHYEDWVNGTAGGPNYYLSSGGVYSMHGDFFAAWDNRLQNGLVDNCFNTHITSCHVVQVDESGNVTHNGTYLFNLSQYPATSTPLSAGAAAKVPPPAVAAKTAAPSVAAPTAMPTTAPAATYGATPVPSAATPSTSKPSAVLAAARRFNPLWVLLGIIALALLAWWVHQYGWRRRKP